jgi:hypothetical protein
MSNLVNTETEDESARTEIRWSNPSFKKLFVSLTVGLSTMAFAQKYSIEQIETGLRNGSNDLNRTAPMWINRDVRLDTSFVGPGLKFTYVLTFMNPSPGVKAKASELDPMRLKPGLCNDTGRRVFLLNGTTFVYAYRGEDLQPLITASLTAKDCGLQAFR